MKLKKGCIQVYTGDGKGKTTASLGLALRALGAGLRVYIGQFIKSGGYSEIKALRKFKGRLTVEQYGRGCFIKARPDLKDIRLAEKGFAKARDAVMSKAYDVVILDELNIALYFRLLRVDNVLRLLKERPKYVEVVITGRKAPKELIAAADLVTEMKEMKHYYRKGVLARCGIEN